MRLSNYLNENETDIENIIEVSIFMEEYNQLDEGIDDFKKRVKGFLSKSGLHVGKTGPGLLQMLGKSGSTMTKFFWYAMKASTGNTEAKKNLKAMANKEIHKEDIINFLLKLDTVSMHLVTGPIHAIEALTGWHIGAGHVKHTKDVVVTKIKQAISTLEDVAKTVSDSMKKKIMSYIKGIQKLAIEEK